MRFYTKQPPFYCGIALHARTMYVCLLAQAGETRLPRNLTATPAALLKALAPSREQIVLAAECLFPWYWLADRCAEHGIAFVLGPARSLQALHGGTATNEKSDAQKIAVLLRGGRLPQASGSPAERRATRDLLRRRMPLARTRGALLAPVQTTTSQSTRPALGNKIADNTNRDGGAERCAAPAVHQRIAVALARITSDDALLRDVARPIGKTATPPDAKTRYLRHTVPSIGTILRLVLRDAIPQIARCPRVQDVASSCRLGTCAKASAGTRSGPSGTTSGNAPRKWACSAAAVFCLRENPAGQKFRTRLEKQHRTGKAWTLFAHTVARAVSCL